METAAPGLFERSHSNEIELSGFIDLQAAHNRGEETEPTGERGCLCQELSCCFNIGSAERTDVACPQKPRYRSKRAAQGPRGRILVGSGLQMRLC